MLDIDGNSLAEHSDEHDADIDDRAQPVPTHDSLTYLRETLDGLSNDI